MMNFVEEAYFSKDTIEIDELSAKLPELNEQLEICKREVSSYLDNVLERLEEQPARNQSHISTVNELKQELASVESTLCNIFDEELPLAENTYKDLVDEFNEVTNSVSVVHVICEIHERLEALRTLCGSHKDYGIAVDVLDLLQVLLSTLPLNSAIPFIEELKKIVNEEIHGTNSLFRKEFEKNCILIKEKNCSIIKVRENHEVLYSLFPAIYKNDSISDLLRTLSDFIWAYIFLPVISYDCEIVREKVDGYDLLRVRIINERNVKYEIVYENVMLVTDFLAKSLDCKLNNDVKLLNFIGTSLKSMLAKTIMKNCISTSIPSDWKVLKTFKTDLVQSTNELEHKLKPHDLFDDKEWEYVNRIEEFYERKKCQYFNDKAREIMKKDLHNTIEVGTPYNPQKPLMETEEFLQCSISSNIPELIQLGEELINEMLNGPAENCNALFVTYKGAFFNYGDCVASFHQKLLETIPQQVALFYNNCKYLYRQLQEWDDMFENHETFCELLDGSSKGFYQVEEVGRMYFTSFIDEQKKQIKSILKSTNLQVKKTLDALEENTEKLIRQCLRQQELLKTVWSKVLSYPVYNETIGEILNSMCRFLIDSLVIVEDIEAEVAEKLIEIFKIVLNRGPKLFTDSNEISLFVPLWYKFHELVFVLGASLLDINDRWADGKGPLALQFKPYELKQLIRALFQNTERRAKVLAKIRE